jgi:hypothetical protein
MDCIFCPGDIDLVKLVFKYSRVEKSFDAMSIYFENPEIQSMKKPERTTNHGQATGKLYRLWLRVECTFL